MTASGKIQKFKLAEQAVKDFSWLNLGLNPNTQLTHTRIKTIKQKKGTFYYTKTLSQSTSHMTLHRHARDILTGIDQFQSVRQLLYVDLWLQLIPSASVFYAPYPHLFSAPILQLIISEENQICKIK